MGTPPQPPPPAQPGPGAPPPQQQGAPGMATAAMVCGIIGLVTSWLVFGVILSVLGIVFGFIGRKQAEERGGAGSGMAVAGIVTGIVGVVILIAVIALGVAAFNEAEDDLEDLEDIFDTTTTDPFEFNGLVIGLWMLRDRLKSPIRRIRG